MATITEEKARRYDEAKYIMKEYLESGNAGVIAENTIKKAFPELAEPEDERVRKDLIIYLRSILSNKKYGDKFIEDLIAWLEKQKQKSAACSEEDENTIQVLKNIVRHSDEIDENIYTMSLKEKLYDWLKSIKDRPQLQWKPSDEQLKSLKEVIEVGHFTSYPNALEILYEQLKKLREE